jgi:hypothetical protein
MEYVCTYSLISGSYINVVQKCVYQCTSVPVKSAKGRHSGWDQSGTEYTVDVWCWVAQTKSQKVRSRVVSMYHVSATYFTIRDVAVKATVRRGVERVPFLLGHSRPS